MTATAEVICRQFVGGESDYSAHMKRVHPWTWECKCPRTVECEWTGDERGIALFDAEAVLQFLGLERMGAAIGREFKVGGVRLRVLDMRYAAGLAYDQFYVALAHNPHGDLQVLYRRFAKWLLRRVVRDEARVRGFLLQPTEGRVMPFASWVADRLL